MKISVCMDALCPQWPWPEAVERLWALGVRTVEFWGWQGRDTAGLARALGARGMGLAGMCTSSFELTDPARRGAWLAGLRESLAAARALGCPALITQSGPDTGAPRAEQHASIAAGLAAAAPLLREAGVTLLLEPLNTRHDHPGCYLSSSDEAFALAAGAGGGVRVLYDIYHQQVTEGDILAHVLPNLGLIGHFHLAGVPGRHEPSGGELALAQVPGRIAAAGWQGFLGLEYTPLLPPEQSLSQELAALRAAGLEL